MGKKVKLAHEDSILSKNFKYQKRKKVKLLQKLKNKEEEEKELLRKRQILEVENKVDKEIERLSSQLIPIKRINKMNDLKEQLFSKKKDKSEQQRKITSNCLQINLESPTDSQKSAYDYHFSLEVNEGQLIREKKQSLKKKIEEETKKQIRNIFAADQQNYDQIQGEEAEENAQEEEVYNLEHQCKKESEVLLEGSHFNASSNFIKHKNILKTPQTNWSDKRLDLTGEIIRGYFDHIFIENNQEQSIEEFRTILIQHIFDHLEQCEKNEKSKGFTNCKILILTPYLGDARALMDLIQEKFPDFKISNKEKIDELDDQNDFFRIGIKLARKKKVLTYFSSFDHSEIIISSPVGLKAIVGSEGDKKRQSSFLSSVQILYIDRASVQLMQNWSHVTEIIKNLNMMPKYQSLKNSIDLIRESYVELKGRIYRQSIVFSEFNFPELNALKLSHLHNVQGCITSKVFYQKPSYNSSIQRNFYKIELQKPIDDLNIRFEYFKRKFWDNLHNKQSMKKIIIFTNSYFQYVKLKSFLEKVNASAQYICEHTSKNKIQSKLARFNNDENRILLVTERAYYFQICPIKKYHHIYFYSLPKNSFIFQEMVENIVPNPLTGNHIVSIYTKYDILILERLVGTGKAVQMVKEYCNNVSFIV